MDTDMKGQELLYWTSNPKTHGYFVATIENRIAATISFQKIIGFYTTDLIKLSCFTLLNL